MDPVTISLAGVGATALTEGIKFLYTQAGEVLKRWHEHDPASPQIQRLPAVELPHAFDGVLNDPKIDLSIVALEEDKLRACYRDLSEYGSGLLAVDVQNTPILKKVDELRSLLEKILGQHLSFLGESRPSSETALVGIVTANIVRGEAYGLEGEGIMRSGHGEVNISSVEHGGKVAGIKWKS